MLDRRRHSNPYCPAIINIHTGSNSRITFVTPPKFILNSLDETDTAAGADDLPNGENARAGREFCREWLSGAERFVVQTSGSTGPAKPIVLSRRQMQASARATGQALGLQAGMIALVCLPTRFIAGKMMLVRGLELGLRLLVVEPASDPFTELPAAAAVDFAAFVPLQMQSVLAGPPSFAALKWCERTVCRSTMTRSRCVRAQPSARMR